MGVTGAYLVRHAYRLKKSAVAAMKEAGQTGQWWEGVRGDVAGLGDWNMYVKPGIHSHAITVNSWVEPHTQEDFVVHKIRYLPELKDTVSAVRYVLSHATSIAGERDRSVSSMGTAYNWDPDASHILDPVVLLAIRREAAERVGMLWDDDKKELVYPPPPVELGVPPAPTFKPIGSLRQDLADDGWRVTLSNDQADFVSRVFASMVGV
ncbi:unnamed protein product, partial [marine sediment metagenome]